MKTEIRAILNGRRRVSRHRTGSNLYAVIQPSKDILGNITEMSCMGLSFTYIAGIDQTKTAFRLDLFLSGRGFLLRNVECKTISDSIEFNHIPFSSVPMRRVGVQFVNLTAQQATQLDTIINEITQGLVKDRRRGDRRSDDDRRGRPKAKIYKFDRRSKSDRRSGDDRRKAV